MESIDRNDVNISMLFNWGKEFILYDENKKELFKVYLRIIGDSDLNKAKVYALRKSAEMRKKLKEEGSDERIAYLPDPELVDKEALIEVSLSASTRRFSQEVIKELRLNLPTEPKSDASLEEHEEYQQVIDNWPRVRMEKLEEGLRKKVETERKRLGTFSKKELFNYYEDSLINEFCEMEMLTAYAEMSTYLATYSDSEYKTRMFSSLEEFKDLPKFIKDQLQKYYSELDIRIEDLKKLPGATQ